MNLNIEVISHELQKNYTVSCSLKSGKTPLSSPMLYDGTAFRKKHVYIIEAADLALLEESPADIALIVIGVSPFRSDSRLCDILFIRENIPFRLIFNQVTAIFDRLNAWEQELLQYEGDYGSIRQMLACSHDILGGALTLVDDSFNLLAYTSDLSQYSEYFDSNSPNRTPGHLIEAALADPDYRSSTRKREVFLYPKYSCGSNALCRNLFRDGEDVYYARLILMNASSQYSVEHTFLLMFLGDMIHRTLSRVSLISMVNFVYQNLIDLICRILKEPPRHVSEALSALQGAGWDIHDSYVVTALSNPFERHTVVQDRSFCSQLEIILKETCAVVYGDCIVLVTNISRDKVPDRDDFDSRLTVFLRENLFKAGISNPIRDFSQLSVGYREAMAALELGNAKDPSLWCYHFGRYLINYIIQASSREIPFAELIDDRLLFLKEYDRKNDSRLFETLKTYIKCKYNVTRSAEALFIHRTTFLSRMDRIYHLTQLDLDDWDTRLILMLSIHALENG